MSERFSDEVWRRAWDAACVAWTTAEVPGDPSPEDKAVAAMRAVLEGHDSNVILTALLAVDELTAENAQLMTENARLRGQSRIALADMRDVLERVADLSCECRDFSGDECVVCSARRVLAPSTGAASDGRPR